MAQLTNQVDFLGSLYYNFNYMTGFALGYPSAQDMILYSDIVGLTSQGGDGLYHDYLDYSVVDTTLYGSPGTNALSGNNSYFQSTITEEEWAQGDWFLLGIKQLPWFPMPKGADNVYHKRYNTHDQSVAFNKARRDVLMPTALTVAKLAAAGGALYYGGKMAYKRMN